VSLEDERNDRETELLVLVDLGFGTGIGSVCDLDWTLGKIGGGVGSGDFDVAEKALAAVVEGWDDMKVGSEKGTAWSDGDFAANEAASSIGGEVRDDIHEAVVTLQGCHTANRRTRERMTRIDAEVFAKLTTARRKLWCRRVFWNSQ
jgi:hypothetical protein